MDEKTTQNRLIAFLEEFGFPREACLSLAEAYEKLLSTPTSLAILQDFYDRYERDEKFSFYDACESLKNKEKETAVHPFQSDMLFYLHLAPLLREKYRKKGLPETWFAGAMAGLVCKVYECKRVYDIWGSFVAVWFSRFYNFSLYAIGRLEFCLINCPFDYAKEGLSIAKGQKCVDVHIPSRGRLIRQEVLASYKEAAAFFAPLLDSPVAFHCESWLLFEGHVEMLPENSGIRRFAGDYTYIRSAPDEGDLWRIFGSEDTEKPEKLSEDTALKRAYKKRLVEKKPIYGGEGIFFYDQLQM